MKMKLEIAKNHENFIKQKNKDIIDLKQDLAKISQHIALKTKTEQPFMVEVVIHGNTQTTLITLY